MTIFTIPPGAPFLDELARAILRGDLPAPGGEPPTPFELCDYTLYLPNRRACRAMSGAFLKASPKGAVLLPRIRPLGGADEDELLILQEPEEGADLSGLPAAIGALERRMALSKLVLAWMRKMQSASGERLYVNTSPAGAADLAAGLMRLMDEADAEGVDLRRLARAAPERFAGHWSLTLDFLSIVMDAWPDHLKEKSLLAPVARRNALMARMAAQMARPGHPPVIIAGSTGSIAATAALMKAALAMPRGAVALPGLDCRMDAASWAALAPGHPQYGLRQLLALLGAGREDVRALPGAAPPRFEMRQTLLREALRPVETAGEIAAFAASAPREAIRDALSGVALIAAPTPHEEAHVIALILREAAETPGKTASLVTPDARLARRVSLLLQGWGIAISTSAGAPLRSSPMGAFMDLILAALEPDGAASLLGLLQHPAARLGLAPGQARRLAEALDVMLFRMPGAKGGAAGLTAALRRARKSGGGPQHSALRRLAPEAWREAADFIERLEAALAPLASLAARNAALPLHAFAKAHAEAALALMAGGDDEGVGNEPSGRAMAAFMASLADEGVIGPAIAAQDYPALYRTLLAGEIVRDEGEESRLAIWGQLEARLQSPDVIILGGLNEGVWPQAADPGPWLNRAMRADLGFAPPERRIGQAAHDFCQAFGCGEVFLTRAEKVDGAPAVPCRWLLRLEALLGAIGLPRALEPQRPWLEWVKQRQKPQRRIAISRPRPCPPVAARPRRLSVTDVEKFIANPYAIYARHILHLQPLPDFCGAPDARQRGQIIHATLGEFTARFPHELPLEAAAEFMAIAEGVMGEFEDHVAMRAFWRPRLARFADWFAATEPERRTGIFGVKGEIRGNTAFAAPAGSFTLTARADRIDMTLSGALAIYDYKTGNPPSMKDVMEGRAPQLPLEAFIAAEGGFEGIPASVAAKLAYISAQGGEPPGEERGIEGDIAALAGRAGAGVKALAALFDNPATPYWALRRPAFANNRFDEYEHLSRLAEWSAGEAEE